LLAAAAKPLPLEAAFCVISAALRPAACLLGFPASSSFFASMKNTYYYVGLATALALAGCATATGSKVVKGPASPTAAFPAPATAGVTPDPQGVGFDLGDFDRTVTPCEDFVRFSGGNWLKNNPIPGYATRWGPRNLLGERTQAMLHQILNEAAANPSATPGSNLQKVGDFYASAMDSVAIEKRDGLKHLIPP
jgi:putative endopeptidase